MEQSFISILSFIKFKETRISREQEFEFTFLYTIYQGAGKRPAAQEKQIVRASPEGRCPRPEGPRAAEQ